MLSSPSFTRTFLTRTLGLKRPICPAKTHLNRPTHRPELSSTTGQNLRWKDGKLARCIGSFLSASVPIKCSGHSEETYSAPMQLQHPCPAITQLDKPIHRNRLPVHQRKALFILDDRNQIIGAAADDSILNQSAALALWQQHPWQPARDGQRWPVNATCSADTQRPKEDHLPHPQPMWSAV